MNEPFPLLTFSTFVLPCHRLYVVAWNWVSQQGFAIGLTYVAFKKNKKSSSVFSLVAEENCNREVNR